MIPFTAFFHKYLVIAITMQNLKWQRYQRNAGLALQCETLCAFSTNKKESGYGEEKEEKNKKYEKIEEIEDDG